ncbi:hypothetical protein ACVWYH_006214 [Bradyrhizobium sp. GM24.11]
MASVQADELPDAPLRRRYPLGAFQRLSRHIEIVQAAYTCLQGKTNTLYRGTKDTLSLVASPGRIERPAVEFRAFSVRNSDRTPFILQLWKYNRQLGRELVGPIGGKLNVFEDKAALILVLPTNYEIKRVVRHWNVSLVTN